MTLYLTDQVIGYTAYHNPEVESQAKQFRYTTISRPYDFKKTLKEIFYV